MENKLVLHQRKKKRTKKRTGKKRQRERTGKKNRGPVSPSSGAGCEKEIRRKERVVNKSINGSAIEKHCGRPSTAKKKRSNAKEGNENK